MDDVHRRPGDGDRTPLLDRIRRAAEAGRIGTADADIRTANVRSAQSMAELDLIARDLDLLEQTLAPGAAHPVPSVGPPAVRTVTAPRRTLPLVALLVAVVGVVAAVVVGVFALSGSGSNSESTELFPPVASGVPEAEATEPPATEPPATEDVAVDEPAEPYALTGPGIRAYLAAYRAKFGTTRAVTLTLYDDYAIAQVPEPGGKHRHRGWLYRPGQGWSDFGGVSADFPGTEAVNLDGLDVAALLRNLGRAKRVLRVEDISMSYVNIDYRPATDEAVNVNIYVTNEFHESGYLATRPDGTVERAYPFQRQ